MLGTNKKFVFFFNLCLVHVIWTEHRMSKLVLNVKYLLFLSFLTVVEFYNLGHIQGIIRVHYITQKRSFLVIYTTFRSGFSGRLKKSKQTFNTKFIIRRSVQMT